MSMDDNKAKVLVLFGATGDLAGRMLLPSLYGLDSDGLLPADLRVVGTARTSLDDEGFRELALQALKAHLPDDFYDETKAKAFVQRLFYVTLDITQPEDFKKLTAKLGDETCRIAIYLSTAPSLFKAAIEGLEHAGLTCDRVRMALEKPLGSDLASSREINDAVATAYPEDRTFRIDHYLGKETVQNLLALRFANSLFEPLWNSAHIDHVQITVAESVGLEKRGDYYDGAGALRDMVQNHMLQLLALTAMEPPAEFESTEIRNEKVKVLRALRPMTAATADTHSAIGQYVAGTEEGEKVPGYLDELGRASTTETFVALRAHIDNWRWADVPFYLRTGKRLKHRCTEIYIRFKSVPHSIFGNAVMEPNALTIAIQPDENIRLSLMAKRPGLDRGGIKLRPVELEIDNPNAFADRRRRIAYERLLLDLIEGDSTLFVRRDEVEAQWQWIDGIRAAWAEAKMVPEAYEAGSWGPPSADKLLSRTRRSWHDPMSE